MRRKSALFNCSLLLLVCLPLTLFAAPQQKAKSDGKCRITHMGFAEFVVPKEGGTHKLEIKAGDSVKWTVQNSAFVDWITILDGSSGTGPGTMTIQVEANPERLCRVGELAIAGIVPIYGLPIRILQEGPGIISEKSPETSAPSIIVLEPFSSDEAQPPRVRQYRKSTRKP